MALVGNCMTKADRCPNCGKAMGFVAGLRGLGLRQKGHVERCMRRSKAVVESPATMDAEAAAPYVPPVASGETPWHLKPSVGTWSSKPSLVGIHVERPATDVQTAQIQPAIGVCESEPQAAAASAAIDTLLEEQPSSETQVAEKELTTPLKGVPLASDAREQETSPAAPAASEVAADAFGEQPSSKKAVDDSNPEMDSITSSKGAQLATESLASTPEGKDLPETVEKSLAHEIIQEASQTLEPAPSTEVAELDENAHRDQPCSETTGDESKVGMEQSAPSKYESIESSSSFTRRSEGASPPQSFATSKSAGTGSQKSNNRKNMYRKGTANSQQLKWHVKVQN